MYAIVGFDALLPGAPDGEAWLATDTPAFREVPEGRWPVRSPVGPAGQPDHVPTRVGAFVDGPETDAEGRDALFAWVERVARRALPDAALRERTGLVLAGLLLPTTGMVRRGHPDDAHQDTRPARLAARALGLGGEVDTLDAACASGLFALAVGVGRLARGEADRVVVVGANRSDSAYLFHGFGHLRALSPTGRSRPLDRRADGLLVGEGAVAVAIERLADARAAGRRVHAVIRGVATGSDGRKGNLLAPDPAAELRVLRAAWEAAGLDPRSAGYVECHATGTPLGDGVELEALGALLAGAPDVVVASAKALVGHTVTAAGLAGLLRAVGAVRDGVRLPAVGCAEPRVQAPLRVLAAREAWEGPVRRAGVSAFGFGGTNAHVVLEAEGAELAQLPAAPARRARPRVRVVGHAAWLGTDHVALDGFRIPPVEREKMLPQQRQALALGAGALAGVPDLDPARTAVVVAMAVDDAVAGHVRALAGGGASGLDADRVQGELPNFVANRVSAHLDLRGPSFVVGGPERAVPVAADLLAHRPDLDLALVGEVGPDGAVFLALRRAGSGEGTAAEGRPRALAERLGLRLPEAAYTGPFGPGRLPRPRPSAVGAAPARWAASSAAAPGALPWAFRAPAGRREGFRAAPEPWEPEPLEAAARASSAFDAPSAASSEAPAGVGGAAWGRGGLAEAAGTADLARSLARATAAFAEAHARWLDADARAQAALAASIPGLLRRERDVRTFESRAVDVGSSPTGPREVDRGAGRRAPGSGAARPAGGEDGGRRPTPEGGRRRAPRAGSPEPVAEGAESAAVPRTFDRAALLRHAGGPISSVFGPAYADLDRFGPRVRMPLPPLLLCDRVLTVEGERGGRGAARIVTEYDVPERLDWTADGRPPAFVVVESGQADLFLVSFLGIDADCRGERVYRLLDCDLAFAADRPLPGTTLRHDIRIERFARANGGTWLFYFSYDCVDAATGAPVLRMRNGCAGFFTPAELRTPRGVRPEPRPAPGAPVAVLAGPAPRALDDAAVRALAAGRHAEALGGAFAAGDGAKLGLPPDPAWRLVHRVTELVHGPVEGGIGRVVYAQDLRDDDWFNPVHFQGDPCMPGTLMYEGCLQAVQVWLLGAGVAVTHPDARFEPLLDLPARLRCRGQVVPGHRQLVYTAIVREASLDGEAPWAVADVFLAVDGVRVVAAYDVGVRVVGPRRAALRAGPVVPRDRVLEYSVGSAARAFGPAYGPFDGPERRCARMPGPPLLQMTEVLEVEGPAGEIAADRAVAIAYDVPPDAWFWRADGSGAMPWVILLETALQPCGWLTAWQQQGIKGGADLHFRNLGGVGTQLRPVTPATGRLVTRARQTGVSASGAMQVQRFSVEVRDAVGVVFRCDTQFGYFTKAALAAQKGLPGVPAGPAPTCAIPLAGHPALPRDDLRMLDRVVHADPAGGPAGLGAYVAEKDVDPGEWFFTAHFWLDPVMPGSLGLEAFQQLARWVFRERTGSDAVLEPIPLGREVTWTYRGQVLRKDRTMTVELAVRALDGEGLVADGVLRADGLPIHKIEGFGVAVAKPLAPEAPARRPEGPAALLDAFERVGEDQGVGHVDLDPARHPWLDAHRPTLVDAAVPLAFSLEIAAEAASLLAPDRRVVGIPAASAERWLLGGDGAAGRLTVVAVRDGDAVAVSLANGSQVGAKVVVALGEAFAALDEPLPVAGEALAGEAFFAGGHTFHGEVLRGVRSLVTGERAATAVLAPRPDAELLGGPGAFVLDPLLLDAATHPMWSGSPERWAPGAIPAGRLAYPQGVEGLVLGGERPRGPVTCRVDLVAADRQRLVFDVAIGAWCRYRWIERLVPAGALLGAPSALRRAFLFEGRATPEVRLGRAVGEGWEVRRSDLVDPIPGTTARLYAADPAHPALPQLAAKEALRGVVPEVHPRDLHLAPLRPGVWIVAEAPTLDAAAYVARLHPTRLRVETAGDDVRCVARVVSAAV